ncbi:MAG TPA: RNA 2',3'-cyclic phosphodiesterase [Lacunisphaera sp.]|nr:RNA 2',3'-cyclic phosphodiesterase [Lacunisphaera sp.]
MSFPRLFVALVPPPTVQAELAAIAVPLPGVRWIPAENIHLTLRFIGETDDAKAERYHAALARVRVEPFILPVAGVGVFPTRGAPRVLWAGVGNGHTRLYQLRKQVDEALLTVDTGLAMPSFHPHFTVGRIGEDHDSKALAHFLERHRGLEAPPFRVAEFQLLATEFQPGRPPAYRVVKRFALDRELPM